MGIFEEFHYNLPILTWRSVWYGYIWGISRLFTSSDLEACLIWVYLRNFIIIYLFWPEGLFDMGIFEEFNDLVWPEGLFDMGIFEEFNDLVWPEGLFYMGIFEEFNDNLPRLTWRSVWYGYIWGISRLFTSSDLEACLIWVYLRNFIIIYLFWPEGLFDMGIFEEFNDLVWPEGLFDMGIFEEFNDLVWPEGLFDMGIFQEFHDYLPHLTWRPVWYGYIWGISLLFTYSDLKACLIWVYLRNFTIIYLFWPEGLFDMGIFEEFHYYLPHSDLKACLIWVYLRNFTIIYLFWPEGLFDMGIFEEFHYYLPHSDLKACLIWVYLRNLIIIYLILTWRLVWYGYIWGISLLFTSFWPEGLFDMGIFEEFHYYLPILTWRPVWYGCIWGI